jgi:hypothetical protein
VLADRRAPDELVPEVQHDGHHLPSYPVQVGHFHLHIDHRFRAKAGYGGASDVRHADHQVGWKGTHELRFDRRVAQRPLCVVRHDLDVLVHELLDATLR